jgi:8-oxo-dGTP pyrophosphatase MutT (NUDIX family)
MPFEQYTREQMPSLASGVVIFREDRAEVLLVHQAYGRHLWTTPGGMLDVGEAPADAAVRECAEELGCEVRLDRLVGVYYLRRPARRHRIGFLFEGILDGATPALADDELDDLGWFPSDGLPRRSSPGLDIVIADARSGATGVSKVIDDAT